MQNNADIKIGVSPAYFVSKYGTGFGCIEVMLELPVLKSLGFETVQFEIFDKAKIDSWKGGIEFALKAAAESGITVSAFVAHYIGALEDDEAIEEFESVLDLIKPIDLKVPVAVPVLPGGITASAVAAMLEAADKNGRRLALEIVPGSAAGTYSTFLNDEPWKSLCNSSDVLLDTGHANVTGENIPELIKELGSRLMVLHLSDNNGVENLSLKPGDGNIDW